MNRISKRRRGARPDDATRRALLRGAGHALAIGAPAAATLMTGRAWAVSLTCFEKTYTVTGQGPLTVTRRIYDPVSGSIVETGVVIPRSQISMECWSSGNPGFDLNAVEPP
jgi:hypothetical protein